MKKVLSAVLCLSATLMASAAFASGGSLPAKGPFNTADLVGDYESISAESNNDYYNNQRQLWTVRASGHELVAYGRSKSFSYKTYGEEYGYEAWFIARMINKGELQDGVYDEEGNPEVRYGRMQNAYTTKNGVFVKTTWPDGKYETHRLERNADGTYTYEGYDTSGYCGKWEQPCRYKYVLKKRDTPIR